MTPSVLPALATPVPLYQPLPPLAPVPATPLTSPPTVPTAKPKPTGHGADDAPKLSKILELELAASGLALGVLALGSKLHPHPDMARATREKIFTFFDKAPQSIKVFGMSLFGAASINEQATKLLQYSINAIQIATAIAFHQHVWERVGVVGGQTVLYHFLAKTLLEADGIVTKALFNPIVAVKHLAFERLDTPYGWLPDNAKRWWNKAVQVPLQRHFGVDADPVAHVLSPINEKIAPKSWVRFDKTDHEAIAKHHDKVLHLGEMANAFDLTYEDMRKAAQGLKPEADIRAEALEATRNNLSAVFKTNLLDRLQPNTTQLSAERMIKQYFKETPLNPSEAQRRLRLSLTDLYKLYDVVPALQRQPLQQWITAHVTTPKATEKSALQALDTLLKEDGIAHTQWVEGAAPLQEQVEQIAQKAMDELLSNRHTLRSEAAHQSSKLHKLEALIKVHGQPTAPKISGELGSLLDPYFKLSERSRLTTQFNNTIGQLSGLQLAAFCTIQCVFLANVLMTLVYNTVAKLDPDFDPNEFKVKDIAKKRVAPQPQQPIATAPVGGHNA